jgi:hypothetical protein
MTEWPMNKWMGFVSKREERGVFKVSNETDNARPDISILNMPFGLSHHLFDVRIANSLEGTVSGKIKVPRDADASKVLLLAEPAFQEKNRDYKKKSTKSQCGFTPIIFMSTGGVHPVSKKIIYDLAKHASDTVINLPSRTIYLYVMRACSVALQRGLAKAINKRILNINSRSLGSARRRFEQHTDFT